MQREYGAFEHEPDRQARRDGLQAILVKACRRSLQQRGGSSSSSNGDQSSNGWPAPSAFNYSVFQGYVLPGEDTMLEYSMHDVWHSSPTRCLDTGCHNKVVGGLFMHQVRKPSRELAVESGGAKVQSLGAEQLCKSTSFPHLLSMCAKDSGLTNTAANIHDLGGIGNDPAFNAQSTLYNPQLSPSDWYDTSNGSADMNPITGIPYGFVHHPIPELEDGYPLFISSYLSRERAIQTLSYIQDGGFLSAQVTDHLDLQLVTYNPEALVFGLFSAQLNWLDSGDIQMRFTTQALPAVEYSPDVSNWRVQQMAPDIALVVVVAFYTCMTLWDITSWWSFEVKSRRRLAPAARSIGEADDSADEGQKDKPEGTPGAAAKQKQTKQRHTKLNVKFRTRASVGVFVFEVLTCGLMLGALALWYTYATSIVQDGVFMTRYDVYDGDGTAPCRYHLLRRVEPEVLSDSTPLPASAGRWRLGAVYAGINELGQMMSRVQSMYTSLVMYQLLQALVLLLLFLHLIYFIGFQPRLSVIPGSLLLMLPDLLHLSITIVLVAAMYAMLAHLLYGYRLQQVAQYSEAVFSSLKYILLSNDSRSFKSAAASGYVAPVQEVVLTQIARVLYHFVGVWVLQSFITVIIMMPYFNLIQHARKRESVPQDLRRLLQWALQGLGRDAPSNRRVNKVVDKALAERGVGLFQLARKVAGRVVLNMKPPRASGGAPPPMFKSSSRRRASQVMGAMIDMHSQEVLALHSSKALLALHSHEALLDQVQDTLSAQAPPATKLQRGALPSPRSSRSSLNKRGIAGALSARQLGVLEEGMAEGSKSCRHTEVQEIGSSRQGARQGASLGGDRDAVRAGLQPPGASLEGDRDSVYVGPLPRRARASLEGDMDTALAGRCVSPERDRDSAFAGALPQLGGAEHQARKPGSRRVSVSCPGHGDGGGGSDIPTELPSVREEGSQRWATGKSSSSINLSVRTRSALSDSGGASAAGADPPAVQWLGLGPATEPPEAPSHLASFPRILLTPSSQKRPPSRVGSEHTAPLHTLPPQLLPGCVEPPSGEQQPPHPAARSSRDPSAARDALSSPTARSCRAATTYLDRLKSANRRGTPMAGRPLDAGAGASAPLTSSAGRPHSSTAGSSWSPLAGAGLPPSAACGRRGMGHREFPTAAQPIPAAGPPASPRHDAAGCSRKAKILAASPFSASGSQGQGPLAPVWAMVRQTADQLEDMLRQVQAGSRLVEVQMALSRQAAALWLDRRQQRSGAGVGSLSSQLALEQRSMRLLQLSIHLACLVKLGRLFDEDAVDGLPQGIRAAERPRLVQPSTGRQRSPSQYRQRRSSVMPDEQPAADGSGTSAAGAAAGAGPVVVSGSELGWRPVNESAALQSHRPVKPSHAGGQDSWAKRLELARSFMFADMPDARAEFLAALAAQGLGGPATAALGAEVPRKQQAGGGRRVKARQRAQEMEVGDVTGTELMELRGSTRSASTRVWRRKERVAYAADGQPMDSSISLPS